MNIGVCYLLIIVWISGTVVNSTDDISPEKAIENVIIAPEVNGDGQAPESRLEDVNSLPSYINLNESTVENASLANTSKPTNNTVDKYANCLPNDEDLEIHLVNDTELVKLLLPNPNVTTKDIAASCVVILFYSKYCPFSSMAAPHFNALPRAFPRLKMVAINAMWYHIFNAQNGVVGVPTLILFHNGKPVAKFNESEYTLELFSRFITKYTGIKAEEKSFVTSADFAGPVYSVPSREDDVLLFMSWMFILLCAAYYFSKSRYWKWIIETIQNTWRESEAQALREHAD